MVDMVRVPGPRHVCISITWLHTRVSHLTSVSCPAQLRWLHLMSRSQQYDASINNNTEDDLDNDDTYLGAVRINDDVSLVTMMILRMRRRHFVMLFQTLKNSLVPPPGIVGTNVDVRKIRSKNEVQQHQTNHLREQKTLHYHCTCVFCCLYEQLKSLDNLMYCKVNMNQHVQCWFENYFTLLASDQTDASGLDWTHWSDLLLLLVTELCYDWGNNNSPLVSLVLDGEGSRLQQSCQMLTNSTNRCSQ